MVRRMLLYVGETIHGDGETLSPRLFMETLPLRVVKISSGPKHLAILNAKGKVYTTGVGNMGQLGRKLDENEENAKYLLTGSTKRRLYKLDRVFFDEDINFVDVCCSTWITSAISEEGDLYLWGYFNQKLLETPAKVLFSSKHIVHKIALGATHCIALAEDILTQEKNVYTWGVSKLGGLGRENSESEYPIIVDFFNDKDVSMVSACHESSAVIADKILYVFGDVEYSSSTSELYEPRSVLIKFDGEMQIPDIVSLGVHSCIVASKNNLFGWGTGLKGIIESSGSNNIIIGNYEDRNSPPLPLLFSFPDSAGEKVVSITSSEDHIAFCTDMGFAYTWGIGNNGKLGNGSNKKHHPNPTQVNFLHPVSSLSACVSGTYVLAIPPIFRVPLDQIMQFESGLIPTILEQTISNLERPVNCCSEGIFRLSGSSQIIKDLSKFYDLDFEIDLRRYSVDDVAGLFKQFLRQLPIPCIPPDFQYRLRESMHEQILPIRFNQIYKLIHDMPENHFHLLRRILPFLQLVVSNSEKNKMTLKNLVMCMLPSIFGQEMMNDMQIASANGTLLSVLVKHANFWFGAFDDLIPAQINMAIEEQSFLTEISSLLMNLIKVIDPSKLQEVFISCSAVDKIIGRILSEEMTDDDWRILSDILLFILPLSIDCNAVIQQLQILSKLPTNVNTKYAIGNIFSFLCYYKTSCRKTDDRVMVHSFITELLTPKDNNNHNNTEGDLKSTSSENLFPNLDEKNGIIEKGANV